MIKDEFIRTFKANLEDHNISIIAQPYCVGVYLAITDSKISQLIQQCMNHKDYLDWIKEFQKELEDKKYIIEIYICKFTDFLTEKEFKEYIQ
jgi:hypothetical protein